MNQSLVILIQKPAVQWPSLLANTREMFGYSIAASADASHKQLSDSERFLSCLSSMKDENAPVGLPPSLLTHVSFSILVACIDYDLLEILECCSSMAFTTAATTIRGVQSAVITGTLSQWKVAVLSGCHESVDTGVRAMFNKILGVFESENLGVWQDCSRKPHHDNQTLLLKGPS